MAGIRIRAGRLAWMLCWVAACAHPMQTTRGFLSPEASAAKKAGKVGKNRYALVIGNQRYAIGELGNPGNDLRDMTEVLRAQGFTVLPVLDGKKADMDGAIASFARSIKSSPGVHVFYYSGHGVQLDGVNYLIPVDARPTTPADLPRQSVALDAVFKAMQSASDSLELVFLDACRNNPFPAATRSASGLAKVDPPDRTILTYATAAGRTADDGERGTNGVYTGALLENLQEKGLTIEQVLAKTGARVQSMTRSQQTPALFKNYWGEDVYLNGRKEDARAGDLLNWARVNFSSEKYIEAHALASHALAAQRDQLDEEARTEALELLDRARNNFATLRLQIKPASASVQVDGDIVHSREGELQLDPGAHVVKVYEAGFKPSSQRVDLHAGRSRELPVMLKPERMWLPWALGGAAAGALITSIATGVASGSSEDELQKRCPSKACTGDYDWRAEQAHGRRLALTSDVTLGIGIAATVAAVVTRIWPTWGRPADARSYGARVGCDHKGCMAEAKFRFDLAAFLQGSPAR
jgi:hypothetical protein